MKPKFLIFVIFLTLTAVLLSVGLAYYQVFLRKLFEGQKIREKGHQESVPFPTLTPYLPALLQGEHSFKVPVLLYHYVEHPPKEDKTRVSLSTFPEVFDKQLQILASHGYTPITFDELIASFDGNFTMPNKPVILTFDDGYADFYTNAYPILTKYKMKAVAFIPTGLIGGGNYMTWREIEELSHSPYVVFAAHSVHHYYLPKVSDAVLKKELEESKEVLRGHVGYPINWMAYPYGAFDNRVVSAAKQAGFLGSATTLPGSWQYRSRFFYIPRYRVGNRLDADFIKLVL